ncbi:hypothetical protein IK146_00785 [Candidatus Saccharibacteria bacterium]|nr:hypothetical protein [Candidatus Saccharibacteria bacterium]
MKKFLPFILSIAIVLLALPYLSTGTSAFMAKWAYDWGLPVPVVKLILILIAALILLGVFKLIKKAVAVLAIAVLVMVGLNALGLYSMRTDPKDIVAQVSKVASENSETIVTSTKDLFYQASVYVTEVNPVQTMMDFASGEDSYWYMAKKDEEVDFSQEVFQGYEVVEEKEVGEFKAYHLAREK